MYLQSCKLRAPNLIIIKILSNCKMSMSINIIKLLVNLICNIIALVLLKLRFEIKN